MDISEKYIEMCSKATEIQEKLKEFKYEGMKALVSPSTGLYKYIGFYFYRSEINKLFCAREIDLQKRLTKDNSLENYLPNDIWLPRQDQLHDISRGELNFIWGVLGAYWSDELGFNDTDEYLEKYLEKFESIEQKYLAFIMKNTFNKVWSFEKEDWELIKN